MFADHPDSFALRHSASAAIDGSQPGPCNGVTVDVGHDLCSISPRNIGNLRCSLVGEARLWTSEFVGRKRLGAGQILDLFVRPACLGFWPPLVANSAQMHLDCEEIDTIAQDLVLVSTLPLRLYWKHHGSMVNAVEPVVARQPVILASKVVSQPKPRHGESVMPFAPTLVHPTT